ncbi:hypothetical protein Taro_037286, partial [Colocasia esculenta]|nr:hypothetical protein [Colocasia esculenta]
LRGLRCSHRLDLACPILSFRQGWRHVTLQSHPSVWPPWISEANPQVRLLAWSKGQEELRPALAAAPPRAPVYIPYPQAAHLLLPQLPCVTAVGVERFGLLVSATPQLSRLPPPRWLPPSPPSEPLTECLYCALPPPLLSFESSSLLLYGSLGGCQCLLMFPTSVLISTVLPVAITVLKHECVVRAFERERGMLKWVLCARRAQLAIVLCCVQPSLHGSSSGASVPSSAFFGASLKKVNPSSSHGRISTAGTFKVMAVEDLDEEKQTETDRWAQLYKDTSDDQQDITRGKGMVDSVFQANPGDGTHYAVMSSYEYISSGLRQYNLDNNMNGFYIAPAFMDKLVVHITKNYMNLPNIKIPLILGIWGGKGQGKSFQCELVFAKMGIKWVAILTAFLCFGRPVDARSPIMMSAGELESGNAGEPAKLIRQRYREAADIIKKGKMCCLFINDLDAGAGRMGGTTQYTVNNQMVNATLMNIADNPTNVQLPGMYNKQENPRVPIIVTGNDFSTLYAPLIRDGRMEKFYWAPTRDDRVGVCTGIFRSDNVPAEDVVKLVDTFPGQSIDFFGAVRARVYDDEVRKWISETGVETVGRRLVNSLDGPPTFEQPKMTLEKLLEYGNMLVQEQENVKRVQLADKYLSEAALGDANKDAMETGAFFS